jgi:MFS family permease
MSSGKNTTGWLVVLGSTISLIVSNGPILFFTFAVFLKPISEQLGWLRGTMSLAVTLGLVLGGVATPIAGILIDRWGIQKVTLAFITIFAASFSAISLTGTDPLGFIVLYAIAGFFAGGQAPLPYAKAISGWFEERRGLALGIAMAGVGIGLAVVPQVVRALLNAYDWRTTYLIVGGLTWLIAFPSVLFFVKDPPHSRVGAVALTGARAEGDDMSTAVRRKDFWLTLIASFLVVIAINGVIAHLVALLTDQGLPTAVSVKMLVAVGLSAIAGRLISGFLLDRFFAPHLAAIIFVIPLIGLAMLFGGVQAVPLVLLASICLGFGLGAEVDIIGFLVGRYFGLRRYGEIYGYIFAVFTIGSGLGPYLMGATFDATGTYKFALAVFCGLLVVSSILIAMMGPYRYPEKGAVNAP